MMFWQDDEQIKRWAWVRTRMLWELWHHSRRLLLPSGNFALQWPHCAPKPWHGTLCTKTIAHLTLPPDRNIAMGKQKEQRLCSPVLCKCKTQNAWYRHTSTGTGTRRRCSRQTLTTFAEPPPFLKSHSIGMQGRWWEPSAGDCHEISIFTALAMYLTDMIMLFGNALWRLRGKTFLMRPVWATVLEQTLSFLAVHNSSIGLIVCLSLWHH